jgi:hypothetical protein
VGLRERTVALLLKKRRGADLRSVEPFLAVLFLSFEKKGSKRKLPSAKIGGNLPEGVVFPSLLREGETGEKYPGKDLLRRRRK